MCHVLFAYDAIDESSIPSFLQHPTPYVDVFCKSNITLEFVMLVWISSLLLLSYQTYQNLIDTGLEYL